MSAQAHSLSRYLACAPCGDLDGCHRWRETETVEIGLEERLTLTQGARPSIRPANLRPGSDVKTTLYAVGGVEGVRRCLDVGNDAPLRILLDACLSAAAAESIRGGGGEPRSLAAIRRYRIDADSPDRDRLPGIEMLRSWLRGVHFHIVGIDAQSMGQDEIAHAIGEWPRGSVVDGRDVSFTVAARPSAADSATPTEDAARSDSAKVVDALRAENEALKKELSSRRGHSAEWHREHPIFCTMEEMKKPAEEILESVRSDLANLRGKLSDIGSSWPGYWESTVNSEGAITCVLQSLYGLIEEIKQRKRVKP